MKQNYVIKYFIMGLHYIRVENALIQIVSTLIISADSPGRLKRNWCRDLSND